MVRFSSSPITNHFPPIQCAFSLCRPLTSHLSLFTSRPPPPPFPLCNRQNLWFTALSSRRKSMKGQSGQTRSRNGANLGHAHLLNQRVILEIVRLHGPVSRVDAARLAGLTNQTVFNIVDSLHQIGLIRDFGRKMAERGQPAKLFEINADAAFSVGLHL
jgi:hypothetical protein